jgi:hypothetical protein
VVKVDLRYIGFDQAKNIREYRFKSVAEGETQHFLVSVDLALFVKHNVGLQEGPALCLKRLSADLETLQQSPHELTSDDLAAHVSAQAAAAERKTGGKWRNRRIDQRPHE